MGGRGKKAHRFDSSPRQLLFLFRKIRSITYTTAMQKYMLSFSKPKEARRTFSTLPSLDFKKFIAPARTVALESLLH